MATPETYVNSARVSELWAAIKTQLALKADASELENYATPEAVATAIVTALADYATDDDVTSAITTALADYMTSAEVTTAIAEAVAKAGHFTVQVVDALPATGVENTLYLIPATDSADKNTKDEYIWVNNDWEIVGSTAVDLTNYWSKDDLKAMTAEELSAILV